MFMLMSHEHFLFYIDTTTWRQSDIVSVDPRKVSDKCPSKIPQTLQYIFWYRMTGDVRWALALKGCASILRLNVPFGHPLAFHEIGRDLEVGKSEDVQGIERYPVSVISF